MTNYGDLNLYKGIEDSRLGASAKGTFQSAPWITVRCNFIFIFNFNLTNVKNIVFYVFKVPEHLTPYFQEPNAFLLEIALPNWLSIRL